MVHDGRYESFSLRLWVRGGHIVRGEVTHALTGASRGFVNARDALRFIRRRVADSTPVEDVLVEAVRGQDR